MSNINIQNTLFFFKSMTLKEKEILFWECIKVLSSEKRLLLDSFSKEEIEERFNLNLIEKDFQYLIKHFDIKYGVFDEILISFIEDTLYEKKGE